MSAKTLLFVLIANIAWIAGFGSYAKLRLGAPRRDDNLWWRVAVGGLMLVAFVWGFELLDQLGSGLMQLAVVEAAFVAVAVAIGLRSGSVAPFACFALVSVVAQVTMSMLIPAGTFAANHMGTIVTVVPGIAVIAVVESWRLARRRSASLHPG